MILSRKARPHSAVKGYGEHADWLEVVEQRRRVARESQALTHRSSRSKTKPPLQPMKPVTWQEECVEMVGVCRNCLTQAINAI
mmetsp:Transcript_9547/g.31969  ORF Transcript_9547/g.31969 Transcript_9547/m.31969 type:complete len:83 (+) Transcript_9547:1198-1446(+)